MLTLEEIQALREWAREHGTKPRVAQNGVPYFEIKTRDGVTFMHAPMDGTTHDPITGEKIVIT